MPRARSCEKQGLVAARKRARVSHDRSQNVSRWPLLVACLSTRLLELSLIDKNFIPIPLLNSNYISHILYVPCIIYLRRIFSFLS
ncbi:hypothetical protein FGO68_gene6163 [Halteria grandinella]|uniref:Uncharacterized protein n=1 Tax=Halteria grandinella TaxID=5974 RepID=A0A8J8NMX8_HALGN|nr:hypothetical protein FGO68_gene6163 [Halteria grandinella]